MQTQRRTPLVSRLAAFAGLLACVIRAEAFHAPEGERLENYDERGQAAEVQVVKQLGLDSLKSLVPHAKADFDPVTGAPRWVRSESGFLTGPGGKGGAMAANSLAAVAANDAHRVLKAFLNGHSDLFGHGAGALDSAILKRAFVTPHSGLKTVIWEQQLDGIPVFEGLLVAHTTGQEELVSVCSGFMANPAQAADEGTPGRARFQAQPKLVAAEAVSVAARDLGESPEAGSILALETAPATSTRAQRFSAPVIKGEATASLVWLPLDPNRMRLCWQVILTSRSRDEMFQGLIDAETGTSWLRRNLTCYITAASYRVYTSDSPSPFSPGYSYPTNAQPPLTDRSLLTLSALNTNASPNGWIDDGVNETRGNNVDAHTDWNGDNWPDLPRPQGSPVRVFDFPLDLAQAPRGYANAAVVQLFYWNNWMHDRLYELGFTEAAGNFQNNNFGRGGVGSDAVQADAQDGGGYNNANFSTPPDGYAGRMQMYVFTGPTPDRDGDLDADIILHEYTHGLSNRRVGGGVGLSALQSEGMGEGWSDFFGLALLSEAGDDVDGVYAEGGYATYLLGGLTQNYYFGIRRYPYCTDLNRNPLTFKDIDPSQASQHPGIPRSPIIGNTANEVHNMGEVWCMTLWEARGNLIRKYGWAVGNQLMLQLVTDGMNLAPANPNFLQARDAILQADRVNSGGANLGELWAGFAKRGMGVGATSPSSSTTTGVHESFGMPNTIDSFAWSPIASFQFVDQPFSVTLTALDGLNHVLTNYNAPVNLSCFSATRSNVLISPPVSGNFSNGVWTGEITVHQSVRDGYLRAADAAGHTGLSSPFTAAPSNQPPIIITQPASQTVYEGMSAAFSVEADGTLPMAYQWMFEGAALAGATGTSLELVHARADQAGNYSVSISNALGSVVSSNALLTVNPPPPCAPVSEGLVAWWPAEGTGSDIIGGNDGTLLNGVTFTNGEVGQAFVFNGVNQAVQVADAPALNPTNGLTLEIWVYVSRYSTNDSVVIIGKDDPYAARQYLISLVQIAGRWVFRAHVGVPGGFNILDGTTAIGLGQWYHVAMTYDGSALRLYLNGLLDASRAVSGPVITSSEPLYLGSYASGPWWFSGLLDEPSLFSRALTLAEIQTIYYAGPGGKCFSLTPPVVFVQPADQTVPAGGSARFSVTAGGTPPLSYQWRKAGGDLPGATNSAFTLSDVWTNDSGNYSVVVTNAAGVAVSSNAVLTVVAQGPVITSQPCGTNGVLGAPFTLRVAATGAPAPGYQWRKDGLDLAGATNSLYVVPAAQFTDAGTYAVVVSNRVGAVLSSNALVSVTGLPPVITGQPAGTNVWLGSPLRLSVLATGTPPLLYQWHKESIALAGATNSDLVFASVQTNDAGTYAVLVTNAWGGVWSSNALLTVMVPQTNCTPPPPNLVSWWPAKGTAGDALGGNDGTLVNGAGFAAGKVGQAFAFNGQSQLVEIPDSPSLNPTGALSVETWVLITAFPPGDSAGIIDKDNGSYSRQYMLAIGNFPGRWVFRPHVRVASGYQVFSGATGLQTNTWYHVAMTYDGAALKLYVNGNLDGSLAVSGPIITTTQPLRIGGLPGASWCFNGRVDEASLYGRALTALEIQFIYNSGVNGKCPTIFVPVITSQPASLAVNAGSNASFAVTASGTRPLSYQWRKEGGDIPGATNSAFTLSEVWTNNSGNYSVVVTNAAGVAVSSNAVLTVIAQRPLITSQPSGTNVVFGAPFTLRVAATGAPAPGYQWRKDGLDLAGATNSLYVVPAAQFTDAGTYAVVVSNRVGAVLSSNALVSVTGQPPAIAAQPAGTNVLVGSAARLSVLATGTPPLLYQWHKEGIALSGATNSDLVFASVQTDDAGTYAVLVTNAWGGVWSSNALLTVMVPQTNCTPPPPNLISWWPAEGTAGDIAGGDDGTLVNGAGFAAGKVGQAFAFNGQSQLVEIPDSLSLNPTGALSLEAWVLITAFPAGDSAGIIDKDDGSYARQYMLAIGNFPGRWVFRPHVRVGSGYPVFNGATGLQTNTWYHVAMTYDGAALKLYVNGNLDGSLAVSGPIITTTQPLRIGGLPGGSWFFNGRVDEASLYGRALTAIEIQSIYTAVTNGKCPPPVAPRITAQPQGTNALVNSTVRFSVGAAGTPPLAYQWYKQSQPLAAATSSELVLVHVQKTDSGSYSVIVTNLYGSATSSNALLNVVGPGRNVLICGTNMNITVQTCLTALGHTSTVVSPGAFNTNSFTGFDAIWLGSSVAPSVSRSNDMVSFVTNGGILFLESFTPASVGYGFPFAQQLSYIPAIGNLVRIVDSNSPVNVNLTSSSLSGWGTSSHGYFTNLAGFAGLTDTGTNGPQWVTIARPLGKGNLVYTWQDVSYHIQYGAGGTGPSSAKGIFLDNVLRLLPVNQPPVAADLAAATLQNLPLTIGHEQLLLLCSDPDGDPLTISGVSTTSTNGGAILPGTNWSTYVPPPDFIGADRFAYTVSDGRGGSNSAYVFVQVRPANVAFGNLLTPVPGPDGVLVTFVGLPGRAYTLQRGETVVGPWVNLASVLVDLTGLGAFTDTNMPPAGAYYRTVYP